MSLPAYLHHAFTRMRHRRGFGIHSPFAFGFVTTVLGERKAAYYQYGHIAALRGSVPSPRLSRRRCLMLFRVVNFFQPASVFVLGELSGEEVAPILSVSERMSLFFKDSDCSALPERIAEEYGSRLKGHDALSGSPDMVVVGSIRYDAPSPEIRSMLEEAIGRGTPIVFLAARSCPELLSYVRAAMRRGMTFHNDGDLLIAVPGKGLPRQDFRVMM